MKKRQRRAPPRNRQHRPAPLTNGLAQCVCNIVRQVNDRKGRIAIGMPIDASGQFRPAMHHDSSDQVKFSRAISAEEAAGPQEPAG